MRGHRYTPEQLFSIVKHGIKFTGMPAWPVQQRDDDVWAMVAFLRRLPDLDAAGYRRLAYGEPDVGSGAEPPLPATGAAAPPRVGKRDRDERDENIGRGIQDGTAGELTGTLDEEVAQRRGRGIRMRTGLVGAVSRQDAVFAATGIEAEDWQPCTAECPDGCEARIEESQDKTRCGHVHNSVRTLRKERRGSVRFAGVRRSAQFAELNGRAR
jgi:hypothetical protein